MIRLTEPVYGPEEYAALSQVMDSGFLSPGPAVRSFEEKWAQRHGVAGCVAVSSGTLALIAALNALKDAPLSAPSSPGDYVITTDYTCAPTVAAIVHAGYEPVFVDVEPDSLGISPERLDCEIKLRKHNVFAVIPVHVYGAPVSQAVFDVCADNNVRVVEDACEAHGATIGDKQVGSIGTMGCFSFRGDKMITTGGTGGAVLTNDLALDGAVRAERDLFLQPSRWRRYDADGYGLGCQMSELQASFGTAQIDRLDGLIAVRRELAALYTRLLDAKNLPVGVPQAGIEGHVWWRFFVLLLHHAPKQVFERLHEGGVESFPAFTPMSVLFGGLGDPPTGPESGLLHRQGLCLPLHPGMTADDVVFVVDQLEDALR